MRTLTTPLCDRLGFEVPVVQAPIGSATTPALAAAVSQAGGLGTLALTWVTPHEARLRIQQTRHLTSRPFAVNLVLDFPIDDLLTVCLEEQVPIVSTFWGDPSAVTARIHDAGRFHVHTVGSVPEADQAQAAGVDVVVAQGWEAGGHVRGQISTLALVPAVVDQIAPTPVIAGGGIGDGRGLAAALSLGAQAAWIGTRFLTACEANTHEVYRDRLIDACAADAVLTDCFDGGWPNAPHRVLRNSTLTMWEDAGRPTSPNRPGENTSVATDRRAGPRLRYHQGIPTIGASGELEAMALYAGQSVTLTRDVLPAGQIVAQIVEQAAGILNRPQHATAERS